MVRALVLAVSCGLVSCATPREEADSDASVQDAGLAPADAGGGDNADAGDGGSADAGDGGSADAGDGASADSGAKDAGVIVTGPVTFTAAPVIFGSAEIGSTLSTDFGVATGSDLPPTVQWLANGAPIAGATSATYVVRWENRYQTLTSEVRRSNSGGSSAVSRSTNALKVTPNLSAGYHGDAGWFDGSMLRWMPKALVAPLEPGVTPGLPAVSRARFAVTFPDEQDVYIRGDTHFSPKATPIGRNLQFTGGRNAVFTAVDTAGYKIQWLSARGDVHFIGLTGDFGPNPDSDGIFYGGSPSKPGGTQSTYIQGCRYLRMHGTDRDYYLVPNDSSSGNNEAPIVSIRRISTSEVQIQLGALPTGFRPPLDATTSNGRKTYNSYLMVYGVQVSPGLVTPLNADWNTRYEVERYDPTTRLIVTRPAFVGDGKAAYFTPATGSAGVANTGTCAVTQSTILGQHTDFAQQNKGSSGPTFRHGNTVEGNYTLAGIAGNEEEADDEFYLSCENYRIYQQYNPQEYRAPVLYLSLSAGSPYRKELTNVYLEGLRVGNDFEDAMYPSVAQGSVESTVGGRPFLAFDGPTRSNWRGGMTLGLPPGGDYAKARANWWTYSATFWGQRDPTRADLGRVTLDTATAAATAAPGTHIGWVDVEHTLPGADSRGRYPTIIDLEVSGPNASKVQLSGRELQKGAGAWAAGVPFTVVITPTVRDSAARYGAVISGAPVTLSITPR